MAHIIADRVKETSTTTGTGALTLAGAESKYVAFSSVMAAGDTCYYAIVNRDAAEWEVGLGTYNTTLARTTVLASSNAGSAVNLSAGTKEVMLVLAAAGVIAAERAIILGVTQASHGFAVGNAVYHTGSAWAKAKADAVGTAEALGIVSSVPDTGTAQITMAGYISGLSGLTAGTVYFLSDSTAGALTATEPSTAGYVSKPMLVALSTTTGIVINYRGKSIPSYSSTIYAKTSGTATAGQTVITASYAVGYVDVFVNGVKLAAADITATNGTSVTLAEAMAADDVYEVIGWGTSGMTPGQLTSDLFSGDGSDTTFTLSVTPASLNQTWVFVEGVYQQKATYSISGTTLTFTTAPPSGTNNIEVITAGAMVTGTPNDGTVTNAKMAPGALYTQASTATTLSGTAGEKTGIPAGTQEVIMTVVDASFNAGTTGLAIQLGPSSGYASSGYVGVTFTANDSPSYSVGNGNTTYISLASGWAAADVFNIIARFNLHDPSTNTWMYEIHMRATNSGFFYNYHFMGRVALSGALDRIKLYDQASGNSFDAGTINFAYR